MRKLVYVFLILVLALSFTAPAFADKPVATDQNGNEVAWAASTKTCTKISDGTLKDSANNELVLGYDKYGYNYQAHLFNGFYDNYSRPAQLATSGDRLVMKWSDDWLANVDCDGDGKLDRGTVPNSTGHFITSQGWVTNHLIGDGYTDFVKIVWVGPTGPLWGQYQIIQEVYNDQASGDHGLLTKIGVPGLGLNDHWTMTP